MSAAAEKIEPVVLTASETFDLYEPSFASIYISGGQAKKKAEPAMSALSIVSRAKAASAAAIERVRAITIPVAIHRQYEFRNGTRQETRVAGLWETGGYRSDAKNGSFCTIVGDVKGARVLPEEVLALNVHSDDGKPHANGKHALVQVKPGSVFALGYRNSETSTMIFIYQIDQIDEWFIPEGLPAEVAASFQKVKGENFLLANCSLIGTQIQKTESWGGRPQTVEWFDPQAKEAGVIFESLIRQVETILATSQYEASYIPTLWRHNRNHLDTRSLKFTQVSDENPAEILQPRDFYTVLKRTMQERRSSLSPRDGRRCYQPQPFLMSYTVEGDGTSQKIHVAADIPDIDKTKPSRKLLMTLAANTKLPTDFADHYVLSYGGTTTQQLIDRVGSQGEVRSLLTHW